MRQFFKFLFASCLGTFIALIAIFALGLGSLTSLATSAVKTKEISANSVLHIELNEEIPELMDNVEAVSLELNSNRILGLHDIIRAIQEAKDDDDIKGILLEVDAIQSGFSNLQVLREALADFKGTGKFIHGYAPYYTQGAYYLVSVSDRVSLAPYGIVDWRGFSAQIPFFKTAMDRLGIDAEVFYAGRYKSATEPYRRTNMSPASKEQTEAFIEAMYQQMLAEVSASRGVPVAELRSAANTYAGLRTEYALQTGLVDEVEYREEVLADLRDQIGLAEDAKVKFARLNDYYHARVSSTPYQRDKVAVLIAEGAIVSGRGQAGQIGDERYVKLIEDLRQDDNVKAVVLRVNSPGGSANASDHIWQALVDLKASGKPVVVSMGSYAASGGYYIACIGDSIYTQPSTLTGSIGVYNIFPQFQEMLNDRLGITFDSVKTGPFATGLNPVFDLSPAEKQLMQNRTDYMYQTFLQRVSDGRNIPLAEVDSIAQGRVWVGAEAVEIGLADRLGNLQDAINGAAQLATLEDYQVITFPKPESPWERTLKDWLNQEEVITNIAMKRHLGAFYPHYQQLQEWVAEPGLQMRMPFYVPFE